MSIKQINSLKGAFKIDYDSSNGMRIFHCVYNAHTASRAAGLACYWDLAGSTYYGQEVKQAATANLNAMAGVHTETVTSGVWGWIQRLGYNSAVSARRYSTATSDSAVALEALKGVDAVDALAYSTAAAGESPYQYHVIRIESAVSHGTESSTTTATKAYIKCF